MARFVVEERLVVTKSGGQSVVLKDMQIVEGHHFWKVAVADSSVGRVLLDRIASSERQLSRVSILNDLKQLRNAKFDEFPSEPAAECDLGLEDENDSQVRRPLKRRRSMMTVPPIVTIDAPSVDNISGIKIKVLAMGGSKALWLEAVPEVFEYLSSAIASQLGHEQKPKAVAKKKAEPGVSASVAASSQETVVDESNDKPASVRE